MKDNRFATRFALIAFLALVLVLPGCRKDDVGALEPVSPLAGDEVSAKDAHFSWNSRRRGNVQFTLLLDSAQVHETMSEENQLTMDQILLPGRTYTWVLSKGDKSISTAFKVESLQSFIGDLHLYGNYNYRMTDPAGNTTTEARADSLTITSSGTECLFSTPWLSSPWVPIDHITGNVMYIDFERIWYEGHSAQRVTASIDVVTHDVTCHIYTTENRTDRVVDFQTF